MRHLSSLLLILLAISAHAQTDTITVGTLERTYTLRLPSIYDGAMDLPLVIAMHGGFGSGAQLENQSQLSVTAEQEGFIVVYPDGVPSPINIRTWNAGGCCGYAMNQGIDDVGFIDALLDTLIEAYSIDTLRIYATGMSNGGFMSYRLACELSDRIAAIAPVSASMTIGACQPMRPVPVISFHSYLDTSVPYQGGIGDGISNHYNSPQDSVLNAFAAHANCSALSDTVQHDAIMTVIRWHDCDCGAEVITYRTQDGGHSWHGGNGTGIGDPPSQAVSANDLMWEFFQQHSLDCTITAVQERPVSSGPRLHPNPATVSITVIGDIRVQQALIISTDGRVALEQPMTTNTIDVSGLTDGLYVLHLRSADGSMHALRLMIR